MVSNSSKPDNSHRRPRVLMVAYACDPYRGSEPGTGWHRAVEAAKQFDIWVICEEGEFRKSIERHVKETGRIRGLEFRFVGRTRFERILGRVPGLYYLSYNLWHRRVYRIASNLHRELGFDLVHQANICGYREPGYLWRLDVPFVWGPIGGSQNYPWRFLAAGGMRGALQEGVRNLLNCVQLRFSRRVKAAARRAALMMAANSVNVGDFQQVHGVSPVLLLEIGAETVKPRRVEAHQEIRILWSGEFSHRKALHLLLAALGELPPDVPYELRILGKGPLERRWRSLAFRTGVAAHCRWMGWLPRAEAMEQYEWADFLAFTSLRDTAGTVVLEALSRGVPVVCLDHQGAGDIVTEECGIKIPVATPRQATTALRDVVVELYNNRDRLDRLSRGAQERARDFLWLRQGERLAQLYFQVLASRQQFFRPLLATEDSKTPRRAEFQAAASSEVA